MNLFERLTRSKISRRLASGLIFLLMIQGCRFAGIPLPESGHKIMDKSVNLGDLGALNRDQDLEYSLLTLKPNTPDEKFPLLLVLHGSGGSGFDYIGSWESDAVKNRFMVVSPSWQPFFRSQSDLEYLRRLVDRVAKEYPVDISRKYVAGVSAGALVAELMVKDYPDQWRGGIFLSSPPVGKWVQAGDASKYPPVLFIHGGKDAKFSYDKVARSAEVLKEEGLDVTLVEDPTADHDPRDAWNKKVFAWIQEKD